MCFRSNDYDYHPPSQPYNYYANDYGRRHCHNQNAAIVAGTMGNAGYGGGGHHHHGGGGFHDGGGGC